MATAKNAEEFEERWKSHVSELRGLWHTLPAEEFEKLEGVIDDANEIVELAAEQLEDDDEPE